MADSRLLGSAEKQTLHVNSIVDLSDSYFRRTATRLFPGEPLAARGFDQPVQCDWELTDAHAGRVPDRVGNGARRASDPDLTHALDTKRVHVDVAFLDQDR